MNDETKPVGQCCYEKPEYLVRFNGSPSEDYFVLICKQHINKEPYNKHILETKKIGDE
jgi:hypothetical protein